MTQRQLYEWMVHPEWLDRNTLYELRTLLARYPYFQTARLLYLKNLYLLHDASFGEELQKAAVHVADCRVLFNLIEAERFPTTSPGNGNTGEEQPGLDRTLSLIDAFLTSRPEEAELTDLPQTDASTDYLAYLQREKVKQALRPEVSQMKGQDLIDEFIEKSAEEPLLSERNEESESEESEDIGNVEVEDESYFTETLAKIYVKQHRYAKALEIIKKLNLKYPKKNAYFADQIRFLEKLIINTNSK